MGQLLFINPLDGRYGSTRRARTLAQLWRAARREVLYLENGARMEDPEKTAAVPLRSSLLTGAWRAWRLARREPERRLILQKFLPQNMPLLLLAKLRRRPALVDWDDLDAQFQKNFWRRWLVAGCEWLGPRLCGGVTTHSRVLAQLAVQRGAKKTWIVPQFLSETMLGIAPREEKDRPGKGNGEAVFGYLCTMNQGGAADLDILYRAFVAFIRGGGRGRLEIIGGGELERGWRRRIAADGLADRCRISGLLPQAAAAAALRGLDYGLIYLRDNPGNRARVSFKMIEYLAMGVPVIGRLVGESKEQFGRYLSVACDSERELRDALRLAGQGKVEQKNVALAIRQTYDWRAGLPLATQVLEYVHE